MRGWEMDLERVVLALEQRLECPARIRQAPFERELLFRHPIQRQEHDAHPATRDLALELVAICDELRSSPAFAGNRRVESRDCFLPGAS